MIALASLLFAQLVVPSGEGLSIDQKVEILARSLTAGSTSPLSIFEDARVRSEMKRVGLEAGCPVAIAAARASARRFAGMLAPFAEDAVRRALPGQVLETLTPVSFSVGPGGSYRSRADRAFEEIAAEPLSQARDEARSEVATQLGELADLAVSENTPAALDQVFQNSFGAKPDEVWNSAPLMTIACLQRAWPAGVTVESGGETFPPRGDTE